MLIVLGLDILCVPGSVLAAFLVGFHLRLQPGPGQKDPELSYSEVQKYPSPSDAAVPPRAVWVTLNACQSEESLALFTSCRETDETREENPCSRHSRPGQVRGPGWCGTSPAWAL